MRLWVAATDYRGEMSVSDEILKRIADTYRRLRNTARFLLANLHDFNPETDCVAPEQMLALDRWAVDCAYRLQQEILSAYESYQFHLIYQKIHHFVQWRWAVFIWISSRIGNIPAKPTVWHDAPHKPRYITLLRL
ncbi:Isoleucyl-tRNA synthetase, class Ia [Beggiatoa sp. PS]|nr:Isoleucyl-tRNA synthetase, class Ia [Beggiatoa sp. PS]